MCGGGGGGGSSPPQLIIMGKSLNWPLDKPKDSD